MSEEFSNLSTTKKKKMIPKILLIISSIIILCLLAAGGYFSYQYWILQKTFGPQKAALEESRKLAGEVGKFMLLPTNEVPTIATINDTKKLKGQAFFQNAQNGDKILIYTNAREAILYRPQAHLIIGVAPVNIGGEQPSQATVARLALRNGTDSPGLSYKVEGDIQKAFPGANIALRDQAKRNDYATTIVIPLSDSAKGAASDLAKVLNATVATLPAGETKPPGVDILVILGKDKI